MRFCDVLRGVGMGCVAALLAATAWAGDCAGIVDDVQRLACYDAVALREAAKPAAPVVNYVLRPQGAVRALGAVNLPRPGDYLLPVGYPLLLNEVAVGDEAAVNGRLRWQPAAMQKTSAQASPPSVLAF
ncbi:hypothetical protein [Chitinimonas sp.]|uniref:hypothetical protein n=1 Tax=Chitinimonas sp. TaxID=1934313 RepID=UPI002F921F3B